MTIYLIALIAVLSQIGYSGCRIAISLYALELGANQLAVGIIVALYSLCPMLFAIVIGKFADRIPPRLPMVIGTVVTGAAMLLPPLLPGLGTLFAIALVLGLFHSIYALPLEAVVGGIGGVDKRARNYAVITMGWAIASFLGPLVAGFSIDYLGHLDAFYVVAAFALAPIPIMLLPGLLPQAARHAGKGSRGGSVLELWRIPQLRNMIIAGGVIGSAKDLFQFYLPIYAHAVGLSASATGTIIGMVAVATFVIRGIIPFLVKKLSEGQILTYAVFLATFAFILTPSFVNPYALAVIAFVLGLGVGTTEPIMLSLLYVLTPSGRIAEALGLHKTVRHATHLVVPIVFGSVGAVLGYTAVFLSNAALLTFSGYLTSRVRVPAAADIRRK